MAQITPKLQLKIWNLATDLYNYEDLAGNFVKIENHDHGAAGGNQIDGSVGIKNGSIGALQLAANSVTANAIASNSIDADSILTGSITTSKIGDYQVTTPKIAARSITADKLAIGSIAPEHIDQKVFPQVTETLPEYASCIEGEEIYFRPDLGDTFKNILWHLRFYQGGSLESSKWEFIGGPPATASQNSTVQATFTGWHRISQAKMILPKGRYHVTASGVSTIAMLANKANAQAQMGFFANTPNTGYINPAATSGNVNSLPGPQKTFYELPILDSTAYKTDTSIPMYHSAIINISEYTGLNLYARRTGTTPDGESANTRSGTFAKGRLTATPLYLNAI